MQRLKLNWENLADYELPSVVLLSIYNDYRDKAKAAKRLGVSNSKYIYNRRMQIQVRSVLIKRGALNKSPNFKKDIW